MQRYSTIRCVRFGLSWTYLLGILFSVALSATGLAQEKSLLWRVRSGSNAVYILGSIHFLKKENYPLKKELEDAFQHSKKLVLEIDLEALDRQNTDKLTI